MFNNGHHLEYFKNGKDYRNNAISTVRRSNNISIFALSNFFHRNTYRVFHEYLSPNTWANFEIPKERTQFFKDFADHSKKLSNTIKNGYDNPDCLGLIDEFNTIYPKDPTIEDLGIANSHLETGYPSLWTLKNQVYKDSKQRITNTECIIKRFKTIVEKVMQDNGYRYFDATYDINVKYYYPPLFLEIFREIQNRKRRELQITSGLEDRSIGQLFVYFEGGNHIMSMRFDYDEINPKHEEFKGIVTQLVKNNELRTLVDNYEEEYDSFYYNGERQQFFESIDALYDDVVHKNETLKGKCKLCPPKRWIDKF